MSKYVYTIEGCPHKFKTKQEAMDYASFDRWTEYMNGAPQRLTIISRHTPEQYRRYRQRLLEKENQNAT